MCKRSGSHKYGEMFSKSVVLDGLRHLIEMPYISSDGTVVETRSNLRLSIVSDAFWAVINFIGLFFSTLLDPQKKIPQRAVESRPPSNSFRGRGPRGANIKSLPKNSCGPKG
jgi:hypothetical protein